MGSPPRAVIVGLVILIAMLFAACVVNYVERAGRHFREKQRDNATRSVVVGAERTHRGELESRQGIQGLNAARLNAVLS